MRWKKCLRVNLELSRRKLIRRTKKLRIKRIIKSYSKEGKIPRFLMSLSPTIAWMGLMMTKATTPLSNSSPILIQGI